MNLVAPIHTKINVIRVIDSVGRQVETNQKKTPRSTILIKRSKKNRGVLGHLLLKYRVIAFISTLNGNNTRN